MTFKEIDDSLTSLKNLLKTAIIDVKFESVCEFSISDWRNSIPWEDMKIQGLYLIEIKNSQQFHNFDDWVTNFESKWSVYNGEFTPTIKKKRIAAHSQLEEWIPIYLGKSKKISDRIGGHLCLEMKKRTFALKLNSRTNLIDEKFRLKILNLDTGNYDIVAPIVESELRNRINPLVGRQ